MEPGAAAAAYGAETAVEGAVGAAVAIGKSTMPLKASWTKLYTDTHLPRSSHSLSIVKGKAYIFGGEEQPREPVDNHVHVFTLPQSEHDEVDYQAILAKAEIEGEEIPSPRVGHTASVVDDRIYVFGGRGGKAMQPLAENGRVWVFDTKTKEWCYLDPGKGSPFPEPRSYHASASSQHPVSSHYSQTEEFVGIMTSKDQTEDPIGAMGSGKDDHGTIFIHGGCKASGRTADVWAFDIASRTWAQHADAPGPARGGPSLSFTQDRLYRYGGFDGQKELGGPIHYLHFVVSKFNDKGGIGELVVTPRTGNWESIEPPADTTIPGDRSVAGLQPVTTGQGRNYLLLFLGEKDSSSSGHDAAGRFWDDVWSFQLKPDGMTAASFKDATRLMVGAKTSEGSWARVDVPETSMTAGEADCPGPRGWFASSQGQDLGTDTIVLWGGVQSDNKRAGDGWMLTVEA